MKITGIYALYSNIPRQPIYVGKSSDISARIQKHYDDEEIKFEEFVVSIIPQSIMALGNDISEKTSILNFYEAVEIECLKPTLNKIKPDVVDAFWKTPPAFREMQLRKLGSVANGFLNAAVAARC